jgi:hypothetical protein
MKQQFVPARALLALAITSLVLIVGSILSSIWHTHAALKSLQQFQLDTAAQHAHQGKPVARIFSTLGGWLVPDFKVWDASLHLVEELPQVAAHVIKVNSSNLLGSSPDETESTEYTQVVSAFVANVDALHTYLDQSLFVKNRLGHAWPTITAVNEQLQTLYQQVLVGEHTYLIMFQNTEELRATGGFMGSFASLQVQDGQLQTVNVQDIYTPDGQFKGFVTPPVGVETYLSSGNGLRLPDANWWPDFPSSAAKILPFMGMGQNQAIDGVIAINLELVEHILQVTGPIYLPDYQTTVSADNFATVARADRDEFFPGSIAKVQFLSHFLNQLKLKLATLSPDQQQELISVFTSALTTKDIQLYSNLPAVQDIFKYYGLTGEVVYPPSAFYIMSVESNVGINKANRSILRSYEVQLDETSSQLKITYTNNNPLTPLATDPSEVPQHAAAHLHYVNYQRLLLLPETEVEAITFNDQPLATWDEEIITTSNGQHLKQVGFLLEVPEQTQRTLSISITHPPLSTFQHLTIQKQSGLPASPVIIQTSQGSKSLLLEKDELIPLSELGY